MTSQRTESLLAAVPMPLVLIGANGHVEYLNQPASELLGAGLVGHHFAKVLRQPSLLDAIEAALKTGVDGLAHFQNAIGDQEIQYSVKCVPVKNQDGTSVLASFEDVSQLQEADQMRSDFVANVSHELRSPLTALLGFIETLRGPARDDEEAQDRFLGIMEQEASRMTRLVRDLLSLSRVESEERIRPSGTVEVCGLVASCLLTLKPVAEARQVNITQVGCGEIANVLADADQLQQVFVNLIENAIKYGGIAGEVNVSIDQVAHDAGLRGPAVRIVVSDTGDGIDQFHIPRLTERFYRIDSHRSREMGGTGLGLAIVKHIINRHRGRLRISSQKGQGSQFTVILPSPPTMS